jgi:beta-glucosidase-like glycosyl hydrolase
VVDVQDLLNDDGSRALNETLLTKLLENNLIGSVLNSWSSGDMYVPSAEEWRAMNERIYQLSSTLGSRIPKLVGDMGVRIIEGYQAPPPPAMNLPQSAQHTVAACMKHFIGYPDVRTGHDRTLVILPMNIILQYFAPPFQRAISEANVLTAMEDYIELNGCPSVANCLMRAALWTQPLECCG